MKGVNLNSVSIPAAPFLSQHLGTSRRVRLSRQQEILEILGPLFSKNPQVLVQVQIQKVLECAELSETDGVHRRFIVSTLRITSTWKPCFGQQTLGNASDPTKRQLPTRWQSCRLLPLPPPKRGTLKRTCRAK